MKNLLIKFNVATLFISVIAVSTACSSPFKKIPADEVNAELRENATSFAKEILNKWANQETYDFTTDMATQVMTDTFTPEMQRQAWAQIRAAVGNYNSLEYADAWEIVDDPENLIFRMKGDFANGPAEVRVATTRNGKISGFWIKPWQETIAD